MSVFYLDALLGLIPIRTHAAERTVRREHEYLLLHWARARMALQRAVISVEGVQMLAGYGLAAWLLFDHLGRFGETGSALLFVYWALSLPTLGQAVALAARQYPIYRNVTLRLLEPLGAPEETLAPEIHTNFATESTVADQPQKGVAIDFEEVSIRAAGHTILSDIVLRIDPGNQVAILGPSGAGKSSLVALLLGWHRPITGRVLIDGAPLDGLRLESLHRETAWVDPAIQVWNRSLLDNLRYGAPDQGSVPIGRVISGAELRDLLDKLPDGLQTPLGEGGGLVSGGEGQRVRLARAMLRQGVRLVILDEPFRGLDRDRRRELLARSRWLWGEATFLCITHDVGETVGFDQVVIIEGGRIVESGAPRELASRPGSRYGALLKAEDAVRAGLWSNADWRRLRLDGGRLLESDGGPKA